jgi:hypothetical protein
MFGDAGAKLELGSLVFIQCSKFVPDVNANEKPIL